MNFSRFLPVLFVSFLTFLPMERVFAYISPDQFLQGGGSNGAASSAASSSPASTPSSSSSSSVDVIIPIRPPPSNPSGTPGDLLEDPRAAVFQLHNSPRPQMFNDASLPESSNREVRIPDRPVVEEKEIPLPTPVPRAERRMLQTESAESVHRAAPLAPTGLPLTIPVIFSFTFTCGVLLYTKGRSLSFR